MIALNRSHHSLAGLAAVVLRARGHRQSHQHRAQANRARQRAARRADRPTIRVASSYALSSRRGSQEFECRLLDARLHETCGDRALSIVSAIWHATGVLLLATVLREGLGRALQSVPHTK